MATLLDTLAGLSRAGIAADTGRMEGAEIGRERKRKTLLDELAVREKEADLQRQTLLDELTREQINKMRGTGMGEPENYGVSLQEVVDPATGKRVLVQAGNRGTQKVAPYRPVPQPEPREPQGSFVQYVDAEGNPVAFNPTTGATARPPAGLKPAGAAGDRNTAVVRKEVAANKSNLSVIDNALAEIEAYPEAVGLARGAGKLPLMGNIADAINQRVDPQGVNARASLANIGSLVIHNRSGAAVSIHEFPRLAPFVPDQSDTPEVAKMKLRQLREMIEQETAELEKGTLLVNPGVPPTPAARPAQPATRPDLSQFLPPGRRP